MHIASLGNIFWIGWAYLFLKRYGFIFFISIGICTEDLNQQVVTFLIDLYVDLSSQAGIEF